MSCKSNNFKMNISSENWTTKRNSNGTMKNMIKCNNNQQNQEWIQYKKKEKLLKVMILCFGI